MSVDQLLVSIGMPVYNGERFIREALDSLLAQDYGNFELIISDNASTDRTPDICREYAARDERVRYHRNEANVGPAENFNRAFHLSSGRYFMWAAYDDWWDRTYVRKCVDALERNPTACLCCTSLRFMDERGRVLEGVAYSDYDNPDLSSPRLHERVRILVGRAGWYLIYGLLRADILKKTNLFRQLYGPDVILLMELCLRGPFLKVPEVLFKYRQFQGKTEKDRAAQVGVLDRKGPFYPYTKLYDELSGVINSRSISWTTKRILHAQLFFTVYFRSSVWRARLHGELLQRGSDAFRERRYAETFKYTALGVINCLSYARHLIRARVSKGI